jgi:hypothetical protein
MNNAVLMVIRALACIALVFAGGVIATEVNAIVRMFSISYWTNCSCCSTHY